MTQTAMMASAGLASMAAPADHDSGIYINLGEADSQAAIIFKAGDFEAQVFIGAQDGVCTTDGIILCGTSNDEVLAGQGVLTTAGVQFRVMVGASIDDDVITAHRLGALMKVGDKVLTVGLDTLFGDKTLHSLLAPRPTLVTADVQERVLSVCAMDTIMIGSTPQHGAAATQEISAARVTYGKQTAYLTKIANELVMIDMAGGGVARTIWLLDDSGLLQEVEVHVDDGELVLQTPRHPRLMVAPELPEEVLAVVGQHDVVDELRQIAAMQTTMLPTDVAEPGQVARVA